MSPKILTAACIATQLILLAVSFNGLSATQGWGISIESPIHFEAHERSTTAWAPVYFASWFLAESGVVVLSLEQLARNKERGPWLRLPSLGGLSEKIGSRFEYRLHQVLIAFVCLAPLYAGGHFLLVSLQAHTECGGVSFNHTFYGQFFNFAPATARCWLDGPERGVEFFPPWEPWAFCGGFVSIMILWAYIFRLLIRKQ